MIKIIVLCILLISGHNALFVNNEIKDDTSVKVKRQMCIGAGSHCQTNNGVNIAVVGLPPSPPSPPPPLPPQPQPVYPSPHISNILNIPNRNNYYFQQKTTSRILQNQVTKSPNVQIQNPIPFPIPSGGDRNNYYFGSKSKNVAFDCDSNGQRCNYYVG
ncbi:unnamed protein product [Brachionus calyciflorus]|uniref:Uncharacterized protein n=1 Tax=Brachionus calyciflorus TaxID=104777 RepID=A0A814JCV9_9BILA|nr:unnamed protein product [Brachionus calyciflorus]